MPRFFFHVRDADDEISRDTEGQDLPDLDAARGVLFRDGQLSDFPDDVTKSAPTAPIRSTERKSPAK